MANAQVRAHLKSTAGKVSYLTLFHSGGGFDLSTLKSVTATDKSGGNDYAWTCDVSNIDQTKCSKTHLLIPLTCTKGRSRFVDPPTAGNITITLNPSGTQPNVDPAPVTYVDDGT
jgi:hypothetical protein